MSEITHVKPHHLMDMYDIEPLFPVKQERLYFNFAADGPLPVPARDAMCALLHETSHKGGIPVQKQLAIFKNLKKQLGVLFNSQPDHFAFTRNTSEGILLALAALDIKEDENYIVAEDAFPTTVRLMSNHCKGSARTVLINSEELLTDQINDRIDNKTRAIVLDWVHYFSGKIIDLPAITALARSKGIFTVIDGIQGAGALKLDLDDSGIDFFAAGAHKWLMAPQGAGFIYVAPQVWDRITRRAMGWLGYDWGDFSDFSIEPPLREGAAVMEYGTRASINALGFCLNLELINNPGIFFVERHNQVLRRFFLENILQKGYASLQVPDVKGASIIPFRREGTDTLALFHRLQANGVVLSMRNGYLRATFHLSSSLDELEKLLDML